MSKKSRPWGRRARARIRRRTEAGPWLKGLAELDRAIGALSRSIAAREKIAMDRTYSNSAAAPAWGPLTMESLDAAMREIDRIAPAPEPLEYTDLFRSMGLPPDLLAGGAPVFTVGQAIREHQEAIARAADIPFSRLTFEPRDARGEHDDHVDAFAGINHAGPTAEDYRAAGEFMHETMREIADRSRGVIDAEVVQRALPPIEDDK